MRLAQRTAWAQEESEWARLLVTARVRTQIDLTVTNPTTLGFAPTDAVWSAWSTPDAQVYDAAPRGALATRRAIAGYYARRDRHVDPQQLLLTASTSEAYHLLMCALADPGQTLLVPEPSYPLFGTLAELAGVTLCPYPLRFDDEWHIDWAALYETAARVDARGLIVVSPNNPTGHCLTNADLTRLHALCAARGCPLIIDEVFADAMVAPPRDLARHITWTPSDAGAPCTVSLSGLSKVALLPQAKLGWMVASGAQAPLLLERLEWLADAFLSVSGPVQHAAAALLAHAEQVQPLLNARLRANAAGLAQRCAGQPVSVAPVHGGWSALVRLPATHSDLEWATLLLEEEGVLVQPGHLYGLTGVPWCVLSLLPAEAQFTDGVQRLLAVVARRSR